jgi:putative transcriptional regulator
MTKHHPTKMLLESYVAGELPASLSAAISIHQEMCLSCSEQIDLLTQQQAEHTFSSEHDSMGKETLLPDFSEMIEAIVSDEGIEETTTLDLKVLEIKGKPFTLPRALTHMDLGRWVNLGKISRAKLDLNEGERHSHLLYIEPNGVIPKHTHKGIELTLLLEGSFSDEMGEYHAGDFIVLDGNHHHQPMTNTGCLCLTVVDDALRFTEGVSKLLNPIGSYIY